MKRDTYFFDECDKINELSQSLTNIDWEDAGRLYTKSYWEVQYYLAKHDVGLFTMPRRIKIPDPEE